MNDQKTQKIRHALTQLDAANDGHWTEDGLPREGIVRKIAADNTISRKDISDAQPGFQRNPVTPAPTAGDNVDPLSGEPVVAGEAGKADSAARAEGRDSDSNDGAHKDPTQNEGELMTESEVRDVLETRVKDAITALADAQADVRSANQAVIDRQNDLVKAREDLTREFPPMTAAENVKQYIASEMEGRMKAAGYHTGGIAPGSQIDAAMQRSNSRGWRRPSRQGPTQSGAAR